MGDLRLPPNKVRIPNALNSQYVRPPSLDHVIQQFWPLRGDIYRLPGSGGGPESTEGPFMEDFHETALKVDCVLFCRWCQNRQGIPACADRCWCSPRSV